MLNVTGGYAKDYVKMMYMMLQHTKPDDFVVATGQMHSVREFIEKAVQHLDIPLICSTRRYIFINK